MKQFKKIFQVVVPLLIIFIVIMWIIWGNTSLKLNTYAVESKKIPESFKGYKIAHVSDLHNDELGEDNEKLLKILEDAKPDMIAITGDLVDSRTTNIEVALSFAENAMKIAPCYYVTGNHESRIAEYNELNSGLTKLGVVVLENAALEIELNGEKILLLGIDDPAFKANYLFGDEESVVKNNLSPLIKDSEYFTLLLSHRPEMFDTYVDFGIDLVLSGHAHGGQFRIPCVGGLIAPDQGLFPKYDSGLYTVNGTNMIVSRGIGNSIIPVRINNRPEVILIELG